MQYLFLHVFVRSVYTVYIQMRAYDISYQHTMIRELMIWSVRFVHVFVWRIYKRKRSKQIHEFKLCYKLQRLKQSQERKDL